MSKVETKPADKADSKPAVAETKPAEKATAPGKPAEAKPTDKAETKPSAKAEAKPADKAEIKPVGKVESRQAGKGSKRRQFNAKKFDANYQSIDWGHGKASDRSIGGDGVLRQGAGPKMNAKKRGKIRSGT